MLVGKYTAGEDLKAGDAAALGDDGKVYRASTRRDFVVDENHSAGEVFENVQYRHTAVGFELRGDTLHYFRRTD